MQRMVKAGLACLTAATVAAVAGAGSADHPAIQYSSGYKSIHAPIEPAVTPEPHYMVAYMPMYPFNGVETAEQFGCAVAGAGDVNKDGYDDLLIGAPMDDRAGTDAGCATLVSGFDGTVMKSFFGDKPYGRFGHSVAGVGDVDGDGYVELAIGAPFDDSIADKCGSIKIISTADGSVLQKIDGDHAGCRFGWTISAAGDVDGDQLGDIIVGTWAANHNGTHAGMVRIYSLAKGMKVLRTIVGDHPYDYLGSAVSGVGDVNHDGFDDVLVGIPGYSYKLPANGIARVYSGRDGTIIRTFYGIQKGDMLGLSVSGTGDVNGDKWPDVIVGARYSGKAPDTSGRAVVFSGRTGTAIHVLSGGAIGDYFGNSVSGAGDVDLDGYPDVLVGARGDSTNGTEAGAAYVFSGRTGEPLHAFYGQSPYDHFGCSVRNVGDVNNDGIEDLFVGAMNDDNYFMESGSARVILSMKLEIPTVYPGDTNGDLTVTVDDINEVLNHYGLTYP